MRSGTKINGKRVRALRSKRGLSQKAFAANVKVDPGTVSRWERGEIDRVRPDTLGRICSTLKVDDADICDDGPLPEIAAQNPPQKGQMNLTIGTICRNALSLVASRYGVARQQIIEAAPLLFLVAAEGSLRDRRKRLDAFRNAEDDIQNAFAAAPEHLGLYLPDGEWGATLEEEERSIAARDLFATTVDTPYGRNDPETNPFAAFLKALLRRLDPAANGVSWGASSAPRYRICAEEAEKIVGPDKEAVDAILGGAVALHQMPRAIRNASPAERAKWVLAASRRGSELEDFDDFPSTDIESETQLEPIEVDLTGAF